MQSRGYATVSESDVEYTRRYWNKGGVVSESPEQILLDFLHRPPTQGYGGYDAADITTN